MLSPFTREYYHLDPTNQGEESDKDTGMTVWLQMDESKVL